MARPLFLFALLLGGCLAEFPNPPQQVADAGDAALDARVDAPPQDAALDVAPPCGTPEVCDGLDNDCDLAIDESVPLRFCPLQQGVCAGSRETCSDGAYQPCTYADLDQPYTPNEGPGFCDRVDNDCDGATDEGCMCMVGNIRECGTNEGACSSGRQLCEEGVFGPCIGAREPVIEQSNAVDDDCDGRIDEGSPPDEIILEIADIAVGGLGERPGLPGQVAQGRGLPMVGAGALVLRPAPLVAAVFIPQAGPSLISEETTYNFVGHVSGADSAGVHGKGPAGLVPDPATTLGLPEYQDPQNNSFIEMPANYGLSLDLASITSGFGVSVRRFTTRLGSLGPGRVTFFILVDGQLLAQQTLLGPRELNGLDLPLPDHARLLTLVTTNAGEPGQRAAYFGNPRLHFR